MITYSSLIIGRYLTLIDLRCYLNPRLNIGVAFLIDTIQIVTNFCTSILAIQDYVILKNNK